MNSARSNTRYSFCMSFLFRYANESSSPLTMDDILEQVLETPVNEAQCPMTLER